MEPLKGRCLRDLWTEGHMQFGGGEEQIDRAMKYHYTLGSNQQA